MIHDLHNLDGHMNTVSGIKFNIFDPNVLQINIMDICHGLAYKGHFCGQSQQYFSIAQHSLLVVELFEKDKGNDFIEHSLACLMHDAAEAYIGDLIKPIKIHFPLFCEIEDRILKVIFEAYNINYELLSDIKIYDNMAQELEFEIFYKGGNFKEWHLPDVAKYAFYNKFLELINKFKNEKKAIKKR